MTPRQKWFSLVASLLLSGQSLAASIPLDAASAAAKGSARIAFEDGAVHLCVDDPAGESGLVISPAAPQQSWDFSHWAVLAVDLENFSAQRQLRLVMAVTGTAPDGKDRDATVGIALNPGEKRTMRLKLPHHWKYAAPQGTPGIRTIDTTRLTRIRCFMQWPFEPVQPGLLDCRISNLHTEDELTPAAPMAAEQYIPFIDQYGQFIHAQWPQKVSSAADLRQNYFKEQAQLDAATPPAQWDRFGGWQSGPQLEATGNFRTAKHDGKWYLVDPDGRLFISHGLDVISKYNDPLKVMPGHENWFASLPAGATRYLPTELALQQKYDTETYQPAYFQNLSKRLTSWGLNTIGDWSAHDLMLLGRQPYTLQLSDHDSKMPHLGASKLKFYDVFDPAYIRKMTTLIPRLAETSPLVLKSLTDPMCIGYFIDNELDFGNRPGRLALVDEVLKCPPTQAAKQELIKDLKAQYGTIEKLNEAWGASHADWDALLASTTIPQTPAYKADSAAFLKKAVDQYFRLAREAVKSAAPHRLYLGCRFISTDATRPVLRDAAARYCDVLSVNIYAHSAANFPSEHYPDVPVLIGEFHFGVLDRGMFSASLCQAGVTQADRALAYTRFMQGVLVHPNFVGAHWFQYRDQPLTGRGDGEAYQLGFVDVADTPYQELCQAARAIGEDMYQYRAAGKLTAPVPATRP